MPCLVMEQSRAELENAHCRPIVALTDFGSDADMVPRLSYLRYGHGSGLPRFGFKGLILSYTRKLSEPLRTEVLLLVWLHHPAGTHHASPLFVGLAPLFANQVSQFSY